MSATEGEERSILGPCNRMNLRADEVFSKHIAYLCLSYGGSCRSETTQALSQMAQQCTRLPCFAEMVVRKAPSEAISCFLGP